MRGDDLTITKKNLDERSNADVANDEKKGRLVERETGGG